MRYMLDTCVLSELVKSQPEIRLVQWMQARKPHELCISAMTLAEMLRGVARLPPSKRRTELMQWLQQLEAGFEDRVLSFDREAAKAWAEMTAMAAARGRPLPAMDSIIAATAHVHGCKLVTRNIRDFEFSGLEVINPWQ